MFRLSRLRAARERAFLSVAEVAQRSGVARSTIMRLERGEDLAQHRTVRKLAEALDVAPAELIGGDGEEEERPAA